MILSGIFKTAPSYEKYWEVRKLMASAAEKYQIKTSQIKSKKYIEQNITANKLACAIKEYDRVCRKKIDENTLFDLLK